MATNALENRNHHTVRQPDEVIVAGKDFGNPKSAASIGSNPEDETRPSILGYCHHRGQRIAIHDRSPELALLLKAVTPKGLRRGSGYGCVCGASLKTLLHYEQDRQIGQLSDSQLVEVCTRGEFYRASAARTEWGRRIGIGNLQLFASLKRQCRHEIRDGGKSPLMSLLRAVIAPALRNLHGQRGRALIPRTRSSDPLMAFAANQKRRDESRAADGVRYRRQKLLDLPNLSLHKVVHRYSYSRGSDSDQYKQGLAKRVEAETLAWEEVVCLMPTRDKRKITSCLRRLGIRELGTVPSEERFSGDRWDKKAVREAVEAIFDLLVEEDLERMIKRTESE